MYDSVNAADIPSSSTLQAGYINGKYQSYYPMVARFGSSTLSITISAHNPDGSYVAADILDVEKGDAQPSEVPGWVAAMRALNRPVITVYCSRLATWPATQSAIAQSKITPPDYWIADYTQQSHLVPGSVATQWTDAGPYDISITNGYWPLSTPITQPSPITSTPTQSGEYVLNTVAIQTDKNGNGFLPTDLPWSSFVAATIQGSDPAQTADDAYWPGYAKVQNRSGNILVSVVGSLPLSTINVFVSTSPSTPA